MIDQRSPLLQQYLEIRVQHPGMILLFQIGDFYEAFDDDARLISRELELTLTRKFFGKNEVRPLAGIPVRALEHHLHKLVRRGYKIAICDQTSLPGHGLVERSVTRIITPGTIMEPSLLESRRNNFLAALVRDGGKAGLAITDISTGEFRCTESSRDPIAEEIQRILPSELLLPDGFEAPEVGAIPITRLDALLAAPETTRATLLSHFSVASLQAFGCENKPLAIQAVGTILHYLRSTQPDALKNLTQLSSWQIERFMPLDSQTLRNLEIFDSPSPVGPIQAGSLIETLDQTLSPMGGRLLRRYLRYPLLDLERISDRQASVQFFLANSDFRKHARDILADIEDIERLASRIRRRLAVPVEVLTLARSLRAVGRLEQLLRHSDRPALLAPAVDSCLDVAKSIEAAIYERAPADLEKSGVIRSGFSQEVDRLRETLVFGRKFLSNLEAEEKQRTGIRSLKVGYNKVFGYYLEISRANLHLVPPHYIRKQTLTNAERYFTLELKEQETLIANAANRLLELETLIFHRVCDEIGKHFDRLRQVADSVALLDVFASFAECADQYHYARPVVESGGHLEIRCGRHPMIERLTSEFVTNDLDLHPERTRILLLTAPNMAGKSVYLKQIGLICYLAQIGSFVPAYSAHIGVVDRIFTRLGQTDHPLHGQSSFMLEMLETAHILLHATPKSLVLLDEVGRGTATADGLAIARAVLEYLHNHPRHQSRVLFATHYHELTDSPHYLPHVTNFHLSVREKATYIEYLHRVELGRAEKSFGIHVARMAGLPRPVWSRADELLEPRDACDGQPEAVAPENQARGSANQAQEGDILKQLDGIDPDELSPMEALTCLYELKRMVRSRTRA